MGMRTLAPLSVCVVAELTEWWLGAAYSDVPLGRRVVWLGIGMLFALSGAAAQQLRPKSRIGLGLSAMCLVTVASNINSGLNLPSAMPGRAVIVLVGVPAFWLHLPIVMHLILSYPTGRIDRRGERLLLRTALVFAVFSSILLLLTKTPVPLCGEWCGPSPIQVVDDPALYLRLRGTAMLIMLIFAVTGLVLLLRRTVSTPRDRRRRFVTVAVAVSTVALTAGVVVDLLAAYAAGGRIAHLDATFSFLVAATLVGALPLFFITGLVRQRLAFATLGAVLARARQIGPGELETTLARATGDPMLRMAYRTDGGWRDATGHPYTLPGTPSARTVHVVGEPPRAALIHTPSLAAEADLLQSVLSLVDLAFPPSRPEKPESEPMPYTFVSYLREDSATVDRLVAALRTHGIEVWLDRTHLVVGDRWPQVIRNAIRDGAYFIACFSPAYARRSRTHMNEELVTAIEELRLRPRDRRWFLPVTLERCALPSFDLGAGETLDTLHSVDLSQDWDAAIHQLVRAMTRDEARPAA